MAANDEGPDTEVPAGAPKETSVTADKGAKKTRTKAAVKPAAKTGIPSAGAKSNKSTKPPRQPPAQPGTGATGGKPAARSRPAPAAASEVHEQEPLKKAGTSAGLAKPGVQPPNDEDQPRARTETGTRSHPRSGTVPPPEKEDGNQRLLDLLWRFLGLTGFAFLSNILVALMWILAAAQFLFIAIGRKPEPQLAGLIDGLAAWLGQIFTYMTGRGSAIDLPFPFSEFPARPDEVKDGANN